MKVIPKNPPRGKARPRTTFDKWVKINCPDVHMTPLPREALDALAALLITLEAMFKEARAAGADLNDLAQRTAIIAEAAQRAFIECLERAAAAESNQEGVEN